ncbi:MAG: pantoate--beta-alanine ligase [Acidimicrobiia bacterium]
MEVAGSFEAARKSYRGVIGCVPTMGFLHEGHLSLIEAAHRDSDTVVVTLFVNPLQFSSAEDLDSYPRDLARDSELAQESGADVLFAPPLDEVFPTEPHTTVTVRPLADPLEGVHRPGHFAGVATVVTKLLAGLRPDRAYFGRKDAQQLAVVKRLVSDLSFPTEVIGCSTIRESDGLALSSRNIHLGTEDRQRALGLSQGLRAAQTAILTGERDAATLCQIARSEAEERGLALQYAELVDAEEVKRIKTLDRTGFLAVAALVGESRLIDNLCVSFGPDGQIEPDFGRVLDHRSVLYERR